ncbi:HigA family addiction module antitoxin [Desulfonema magnum]|uniref:Toxin-antitoxin system, antitoxin component n=1 Tax=Desulfonema magnum TaxID=45655 RepID=A0A975BXN4_9BACT|nr:HigA family addiction module antitoxin [Desulfonema magnum]QTA93560.1 Toxin-antitoxin system, antitoxin component [Desulfonema magnum]
MNGGHITPVHPGEVLKDELEETGISQPALAKHIGVLPEIISEICRGRQGINPEMAVRLSRALGGTPQFWLNLQNNWELSQLSYDNFDNIKRIAA